jgi:hypothetical protein
VSVDIRAEMHDVMIATLADEAAHHDWTYRPIRPCNMPTAHRVFVPGHAVVGDCSKGCQFIPWWSPGAPDPMGMNWGSFGNSQTLWMNCQHLAHPSELRVGDFATMGRDGSDHAVCIIEAGADPRAWSFGHQGAPNSYPLSYDRRPQQWLRFRLPDYVPTAADKLRARTDWFSWMAWYQGEGDWSKYGPQNPTVRPNVPKVIPPSWWRRRLRFLAARHHGDKPTTAKLAA